MSALNVRTLGDYIRDQREHSQVSLRQLARQAGVSNPYLSQIERGLRKPSAEILQQIAKALRISAEALYVQAGILEARDAEGSVPAVILSDTTINERQKQVLLEIYDSFRRENDAKAPPAEVAAVLLDAGEAVVAPARAVTAAVARAAKKPAAKAAAATAKTAEKTAAAGRTAVKSTTAKATAAKATAGKAPRKIAAAKVPATSTTTESPALPVNPS